MDLEITVELTDDGTRILYLAGSMDLQSRGLISPGAGIRLDQTNGICLEMSGVTFIDSSGLGAIIELAGDAEDAEVPFTIRNPSRRVVRVLEMTGLGQRWNVEFDREPADDSATAVLAGERAVTL